MIARRRVLLRALGDLSNANQSDQVYAEPDDAPGPVDSYRAEVASIELDDDTALVRFEGVVDEVQLVKRGDRWFLRLVPPGY